MDALYKNNFNNSKLNFFLIIFQVDLNHVYGETLDRQHKLRLFKDGKLKYQVCPI